MTWSGKIDRSRSSAEEFGDGARNSIDFRFKRDSFSIYGMEDPWIDYGWICTRCTRETNAKLGEEGHVRGNVRGWLERERKREGGRNRGERERDWR